MGKSFTNTPPSAVCFEGELSCGLAANAAIVSRRRLCSRLQRRSSWRHSFSISECPASKTMMLFRPDNVHRHGLTTGKLVVDAARMASSLRVKRQASGWCQGLPLLRTTSPLMNQCKLSDSLLKTGWHFLATFLQWQILLRQSTYLLLTNPFQQ